MPLDNFDHIQPGDTVYKTKQVHLTHGFGSHSFTEKFTIAHSVDRTTKSQFFVDGVAYWKKNGREVGGYVLLKLEGSDQKKQADHHEQKLEIIREFFDLTQRDLHDKLVKRPVDDVFRLAYTFIAEINKTLKDE